MFCACEKGHITIRTIKNDGLQLSLSPNLLPLILLPPYFAFFTQHVLNSYMEGDGQRRNFSLMKSGGGVDDGQPMRNKTVEKVKVKAT
ncbi:unnamed protein product [Meloidogyne enterolobii]|uniref:Uncharacterized protein n=1 Tax=Meloidogyne enterolobii TaxID=390850 RepID=A0ACB0XUY8_MELEN